MNDSIGTPSPAESIATLNGIPWVGTIELDTDLAGVQAWVETAIELGLDRESVEFTSDDVIVTLHGGKFALNVAPLRLEPCS